MQQHMEQWQNPYAALLPVLGCLHKQAGGFGVDGLEGSAGPLVIVDQIAKAATFLSGSGFKVCDACANKPGHLRHHARGAQQAAHMKSCW